MIGRAAAVLAALFAAAAASQAPGVTEVIPLDMSGPRPTAMLTVGTAEPVPVVFDTGAGGNLLEADYARLLGLPNQGRANVGTPAGPAPGEAFRTTLGEARLGGAALRNVRASVLALPRMRATAVRGVFGPGIFSGRLVHLDLGRSEIRITGKTPSTIPAATAYPYSGAGELALPGVPVEIGGRSFDAVIDTGNPGALLLPTALAEQVPLDGPLTPGPPGGLIDGAPRNTVLGRIRGIVRIGPLSFENPEVRFMDGIRRVNVGMTALRGATIVIDPAERRSWLLPPS